jgi:hypothetical protein
MPTPDDLIIPTRTHTVRTPDNSLRALHGDLETLGLRVRRGHDLRRTFITLARADGGRADVLRPLTHSGERDVIGLYSTFPWPVICAELAKLQLPLPSSSPLAEPAATVALPAPAPAVVLPAPAPEQAPPPGSQAPTQAAVLPLSEIAARRGPDSAGYTPGYSPSYSPDCSPKKPNNFSDPSRSRTCDLRFRKASL